MFLTLLSEIESLVYEKVRKCYAGEKRSVSEITAWAVQDEDIQYIWSMIAFNIPEDSTSMQLLSIIIQEWTILRGHALRKTVLESHKRNKDSIEGKRSLRKELRRNHDQATNDNSTSIHSQDQFTNKGQVAEDLAVVTTEDQITRGEIVEDQIEDWEEQVTFETTTATVDQSTLEEHITYQTPLPLNQNAAS